MAHEVEAFTAQWFDGNDLEITVFVYGQFFERTHDSYAGPGEAPFLEAETVHDINGLDVDIDADREAFENAVGAQYETHLDAYNAALEDLHLQE